MVWLSVAGLCTMALICYAILFYRQGIRAVSIRPPTGSLYSVIAVGLASMVVVLSKYTLGRFNLGKDLESEFLSILGPLYFWEVLVLAFMSSVGEGSLLRRS